ncbi:radical SAM protein [Treponema primitia]|uniref:radical SAM protein n=1 Tax=Treponema primitia TaxID=88058 RepID=UPI0002555795|nr:radical SAM protein [Treponema primitia]
MAEPVYGRCTLCPRLCGADRSAGKRGFCAETADIRIAAASIHRGEEPPITGRGGSGTIFLTGCTLGCVFCQNAQISQAGMGRTVDQPEFTAICLALQDRGAENINLVTGSHCAPALAAYLRGARTQGLSIPLLWNSSAYEGLNALESLKDQIDVYLPDLKTLDSGLAGRFFKAPNYPTAAEKAILRMLDYRGELRWKGPVLVSGVIIRHLVLPGYAESTKAVLQWFADHCRGRALLSLMTQYTPVGGIQDMPRRYVNQDEYDQLLQWLTDLAIEDGFCQELVPDNSWLPDFEQTNPFSSELSVPVWHWKTGLLREGRYS